MTFDANRNTTRIGGAVGDEDNDAKGETRFRIKPFVSYDLSGRKTNLNAEYGWTRTYGTKVETSDLMTQDWTFRAGRKIFKKTSLTLNDRFTLSRQRVTEIEEKKVTWDQSHRQSLSYELSRKITLIFDSDYARSDLPHEEFDEDTNSSVGLSPTINFQVTPKSRLTGAYRMGFNRTQGNEASDATTHQFRGSYAFLVTKKSSASFDLGYQIQNPDSAGATTQDTTTVGLSYSWQVTPKTSFRTNYSRTFTDSTSDSVTTLLQTGTDSRSDSLSLALGFRPHRRVNTDFSFNGSHSRTKTAGGDGSGSKTRSWTFPFQAALDFTLTQWARFTVSYTYTHTFSNERELEETRKHVLVATSNVNF